MSSTRNKRKRLENDPTAMVPSSRRRSRESRANEALPDDVESNNAQQQQQHQGEESQEDPTKITAATASEDPTASSTTETAKSKSETVTTSSATSAASADSEKIQTSSQQQQQQQQTAADPEIGSSSNENDSRPKQPLHVTANDEDPANTSSQNVDPDRASRIQSLLNHRMLLLSRIRLCRTAAEKRLQELRAEDAKKMGNTSGEGAIPREMTDEEEIAAHKEKIKLANQLAKKARDGADGNTAEQRTSLSLRRGSSVGKKMNAALSTLAPGAAAGGNGDTSSNAPPRTADAASNRSGKIVPSVSTSTSKPPPAPTSILPQSTRISPLPPQSSHSVTQSIRANEAPKQQRAPSGKSLKTSATAATASRVGVTQKTDPSLLPLPPNNAANNMHTIRQSQPPHVIFPEAISLRERREELQKKLATLLEKQGVINHGTTQSLDRLQRLDGRSLKRRQHTNLEIRQPTELPRRRKTHWDRVLQEMNWLATDFIEERKWKISCARTIAMGLSSAEGTFGASTSGMVRPRKSSKGDQINTQPTRHEESKEVETAVSPAPSPTKKKRVQTRQYTSPSIDEIQSARTVGKLTSSMISELVVAIAEEGCMGTTNDFHIQALERYDRVKAKLLFDESSKVLDDKKATLSKSPVESNNMQVDPEKTTTEDVEELSADQITQRINERGRINGKVKLSSSWKDLSNSVRGYRLSLTDYQKEVVDTVDRLWKATAAAGAALSGPPSSGKTIATCSILWKHAQAGPHLLICAPARLLRWKYEIDQFSNLNALTFGFGCGIGGRGKSVDTKHPFPSVGDVLLCEYASVHDVGDFIREKDIKFRSVCVDSRHPEELIWSRSVGKNVPPDGEGTMILKTTWWDDVLKLASGENIVRLIVEHSDSDPMSLSGAGLGEKQRLEILASRAAFILGPKAFLPSRFSLQRTVISWARHVGKKAGEGKFERVRRVLKETTSPFCCSTKEPLIPVSDISWQARLCELPTIQRSLYDNCCAQVRGALSTSLAESDALDSISTSLLRLRQVCFSSELIESASVQSATSIGRGRNLGRKANVSQPDAGLVLDMVKQSAKLSHLISILRVDCGLDFELDDSLKSFLGALGKEKKVSKKDRDKMRKVAILASLPETRQLISTLLSCLGLRHEVIGNRREVGISKSQTEGNGSKDPALAWAKNQLALESFNRWGDNGNLSGIPESCDILVSSSEDLTAWQGGLGIDNATVVISMDSDWSGRGLFGLQSSAIRWSSRAHKKKASVLMIHLLCKETIEEKLFLLNGNDENSPETKWPLDTNGNFCLPIDKDSSFLYTQAKESGLSEFGKFPALSIIRLRGQPLQDVLLSASELAPAFVSGTTRLFLPPNQDGVDAIAPEEPDMNSELRFVRNFIQSEYKASHGMPKVSNCAYPDYVISRMDLPYLPVRYFFARLSHSVGLSLPVAGVLGLAGLPDMAANVSAHFPPGSLPDAEGAVGVADVWRKSGGGRRPVDVAEMLLHYKSVANEAQSSLQNGTAQHQTPQNAKILRTNGYAKIFATSWNRNLVSDGNQGSEPIVFFPPLLPGIPVHNPPSQNFPTNANAQMEMKRKESYPTMAAPNSKRPRVGSLSTTGDNAQAGPSPSGQSPLPHPQRVPGNSEYPANQSLGNSNKPVKAAISKVSEERQNGELNAEEEEDFGVLGSGIMPAPSECAVLAGQEASSVSLGRSLDHPHDFLSGPVPCDAEEVLGNPPGPLQLVTLFVKKPFRPLQGQMYRPPSLALPVDQHRAVNSTTPVPSMSGAVLNGDTGGKKLKKKANPPMTSAGPATAQPPVSETRPPNVLPVGVQLSGIDAPKHRLLSSFSSRQMVTGLSMFESTAFRVATMQVAKRVKLRVDRQMWKGPSYDVGAGLPLAVINQPGIVSDVERGVLHYTKILTPLKQGATTGDSAKALALAQRSSLRRSMVSPCRVDFGPFESGFLSAPSGMTGISPPRSRIGVSLPMGVKVLQATRDPTRSGWEIEDDKQLQEAAVRFGMNWTIVARALSGVDDVRLSGDLKRRDSLRVLRSARQCRERWQSLARNQPSLANEVRRSEKMFRDDALRRVENLPEDKDISTRLTMPGPASSVILLPASDVYKQDGPSTSGDSMEVDSSRSTKDKVNENSGDSTKAATPRRMFGAIMSARNRRQVMPMAIPGVPPGGQPNQPVPSHPSHLQSVQSSMAAQLSNGRTEMWPLQILDTADKHRAALRAATSTTRSTDSVSSSANSVRKPASNGSVWGGVHHPTPTSRGPPNTANRERPQSFPPPSTGRPNVPMPPSNVPMPPSNSPSKRSGTYPKPASAYVPPPKSSTTAASTIPKSISPKSATSEGAPLGNSAVAQTAASATPISPSSTKKYDSNPPSSSQT